MFIKRSKAVLCIAVVCVLTIALALAGCGTKPDALPYLDSKITIVGLTDEEFDVTIKDLVGMDLVKKKAEGQRSNGDVVKITAVGPTLETFCAAYDKKPTDFSSVRFSSTDGYSIGIPNEMLGKRDIVLAVMDGGKAFSKKSKPMRVVVVGERAMYWARMVDKITFESGDAEYTTQKIVFLDNMLPTMSSTYSEEEGGDIVSVIDILTKYGGLTDDGKVYMSAYDGLKKNETIDNFLKGYIKYTGDDTPQFCSPDLPEGMNMNGVVSLRTGDVMYYSLTRAQELKDIKLKTVGDYKGLSFDQVISGSGFQSAENYMFIDIEGNSHVVSVRNLGKGVFVFENDRWTFVDKDGKNVGVIMTLEPIADPEPIDE